MQDQCRLCHARIERSGRKRSRLCRECERKEGLQILTDNCKVCEEPISRNRRSSRLCPVCKRKRDRKGEKESDEKDARDLTRKGTKKRGAEKEKRLDRETLKNAASAPPRHEGRLPSIHSKQRKRRVGPRTEFGDKARNRSLTSDQPLERKQEVPEKLLRVEEPTGSELLAVASTASTDATANTRDVSSLPSQEMPRLPMSPRSLFASTRTRLERKEKSLEKQRILSNSLERESQEKAASKRPLRPDHTGEVSQNDFKDLHRGLGGSLENLSIIPTFVANDADRLPRQNGLGKEGPADSWLKEPRRRPMGQAQRLERFFDSHFTQPSLCAQPPNFSQNCPDRIEISVKSSNAREDRISGEGYAMMEPTNPFLPTTVIAPTLWPVNCCIRENLVGRDLLGLGLSRRGLSSD